MLKGQALLNEVAIRTAQGMTKSELCRACGYEIDGKLKFTDFYTELMIAKGMNIPDPIECDDDDNQTIADQLLETYSSEAVSAFIELFGEVGKQHGKTLSATITAKRMDSSSAITFEPVGGLAHPSGCRPHFRVI